jgi:hypothetical protein
VKKEKKAKREKAESLPVQDVEVVSTPLSSVASAPTPVVERKEQPKEVQVPEPVEVHHKKVEEPKYISILTFFLILI